jgi:glutathione S-transferase
MNTEDRNLQNRLLARLPRPANMEAYRAEVASALEKNDKAYRRQRWFTGAFWICAMAFAFVPLTFDRLRLDTRYGAAYAFVAACLLMYGAVEVLKMFLNRNRIELLKEIKQLQLQVLELQGSLSKPSA